MIGANLTPVELDIAPESLPAPSSDRNRLKEIATTVVLLGGYAAAASIGESHHFMHVSEPVLALQNSGRHPFMGYVVAAAGSRLRQSNTQARLIGLAMVVNGVSDVTEAALISGPNHIPDIISSSRIVDNSFDYVFTAAGAAWWSLRNRSGRRKTNRQF